MVAWYPASLFVLKGRLKTESERQGTRLSIVDESLVHCHRGCEFEPSLFFVLFFSILYFYQFIYLFKDIIHNDFQTLWVAEYRFNDSKQCMPY